MSKIMVTVAPGIEKQLILAAERLGMTKSGFARFCIIKHLEEAQE